MIDLVTAQVIAESARDALDEMIAYLNGCTDATVDKALLRELLTNIQGDVALIEDFSTPS